METEIANQPYIHLERKITNNEQVTLTTHHQIIIYPSRIVTHHHVFQMNEVHDMSYRQFGEKGGILYLHTNRGVYPFHVESAPISLIKAYKNKVSPLS
ncbi:hypothetical protein ACX93W_26560 [Paenibacillus sp. CAU 1782]